MISIPIFSFMIVFHLPIFYLTILLGFAYAKAFNDLFSTFFFNN